MRAMDEMPRTPGIRVDFAKLGEYVDDFGDGNIVKEPIFTEQLVMRCLQGEAYR